ncbi:MAG: CBS domain-containing protein [Planctomycetota bacterium]|jgi:CBS domain-containing protein
MHGEDAINEEMAIADERTGEPQKILDQAMIKEPIQRLNPRTPPICIAAGQTVAAAIELMRVNNVGSVLITENGQLIGIITDRDILCKVAAVRADPQRLRVQEVMTVAPETLTFEDSIVFALNKMGVGGFRHVPLVDEEHRPVGIISVIHIVRYVVSFFAKEVMNIPPEPGMNVTRKREGA